MYESLLGVAYFYEYLPFPSDAILSEIIKEELVDAKITISDSRFPVIVRNGINKYGKSVHYFFNYSNNKQKFFYPFMDGIDLLTNHKFMKDETKSFGAWEMYIIEEL